jgi:hypothetical protein
MLTRYELIRTLYAYGNAGGELAENASLGISILENLSGALS